MGNREEGVITLTEGLTIDDKIVGVQFDCGFTSPYFATEMINHGAEFENPPVLLARISAYYMTYCLRSRRLGGHWL
jgi:hypothetical protein